MENKPCFGASVTASETLAPPRNRGGASSSSRSAHNGDAQRSYRRRRAPGRAENAPRARRARLVRGSSPWRSPARRSCERYASEGWWMAGLTGLEPATSCVTGRRSNQLNYNPAPVDPADKQPERHGTRHNSRRPERCQNLLGRALRARSGALDMARPGRRRGRGRAISRAGGASRPGSSERGCPLPWRRSAPSRVRPSGRALRRDRNLLRSPRSPVASCSSRRAARRS